MNKKAKEAIRGKIEKQRNEIRYQISRNKLQMRLLVDNQTALKRELAEWSKLLNDNFGEGK